MIRHVLLEMTRFDAAKETEQKLRWDADVDGTRFSLYIPKWRVPEPWPARVFVGVAPRRGEGIDQSNLSSDAARIDPTARHEPIVACVEFYSSHTETTRFRPVGDPPTWEIGEPYVPHSMIPPNCTRLRVVVLWDLTSRGAFLATRAPLPM